MRHAHRLLRALRGRSHWVYTGVCLRDATTGRMRASYARTKVTFQRLTDADGSVVRESAWKPTKRSYLPAEVDALVAHAQLEARQQALNEIENIRAMALTNIAQGVAAALPSLRNVAQTHREQSADLALAAARAIGGAALERFPQAPLRAALEALAQELNGIMTWIEQLAEVDTDGVEPLTSVVAAGAPLREDVVTMGGDASVITSNAPKSVNGFFVVPKVVEQFDTVGQELLCRAGRRGADDLRRAQGG